MKYLLSLALGLYMLPVSAQQATVYQTCTNNYEEYVPGYFDSSGNYRSGRVVVRRQNVPCSVSSSSSKNKGRICTSGGKTLTSIIGGGIAAAVSKPDALIWSIPLGLVLGNSVSEIKCS